MPTIPWNTWTLIDAMDSTFRLCIANKVRILSGVLLSLMLVSLMILSYQIRQVSAATATQEMLAERQIALTTEQYDAMGNQFMANDLSLIDARRGLNMFQKVEVPVLGIVENMSYFTPPDLPDRKYYLFGEGGGRRVAAELDVGFLAEVPIDPRIVEAGDRGQPILIHAPESGAAAAFRELAATVARKLAVLAEQSPPIADANVTRVSDRG